MTTTNFRSMIQAARKVLRNGGCTTKAHQAAMDACEHKNAAVKQDAGWEAVKLAR